MPETKGPDHGRPTTWRGRPLDWGNAYPWEGGPRVGAPERRFRWTRLAWWFRRPVYRAGTFWCWTDGYVWDRPCHG